ACRTVEGGEDPVPGGVELPAAEAGELPTHTRVVLAEQLAPAVVAELGPLRRRTDDVGEQDGGQHPVGLDDVPLAALPEAAEEALDLPSDLFGTDPPAMILARKLNELRTRHV